MASIPKPDGMRYLIHGHDGYNGTERTPHVAISWGGSEMAVSLLDGKKIKGGLERNKEIKALEWVNEHLSELYQEWKNKSNNY